MRIAHCISLLRAGKTQKQVAKELAVGIGILRKRLIEKGFLVGKNQRRGIKGQEIVAAILTGYGRKVKNMEYTCSFDLLVDGVIRVEVKTAKRHKKRRSSIWQFNLHRHGNLSEDCDCYILRLEDVPECKKAVHLLLKAPQGVKSIAVSIRSLINGMGQYARDFQDFAQGKKLIERNAR